MAEADFIGLLRGIATDPSARGLIDDVAVLGDLVLSHDSIVEGIHYLPSDPPASVAWKLVAVNLSDLAAKGAVPVAALMAYTLSGDSDWDAAFVEGLGLATRHFGLPLIGGDTVSIPAGSARVMGLTVIGRTQGIIPDRRGAGVGDGLFVTGTIGDAGLGLDVARGLVRGDDYLLRAYQYPEPQLAAGKVLGGAVTAMMDVSDGVLIDAERLAKASNVAVVIDLDAVPLSPSFRAVAGEGRTARLRAVAAGDDYQLLFTSALPLPIVDVLITRIGHMARGAGLRLHDRDGDVTLPERLGWMHG